MKQKAITIEGVRLEPQVFVYGYVNGKKRPEKSAWENAKQRCFNPNDPDWPNYGGRGITMCEEWRRSFTRFFLDMGERYRRAIRQRAWRGSSTNTLRRHRDGVWVCLNLRNGFREVGHGR